MAKAIIVHDAGNKRPWDLQKHDSPSRKAKHLVVNDVEFLLKLTKQREIQTEAWQERFANY